MKTLESRQRQRAVKLELGKVDQNASDMNIRY